ncbi:MAG: hypothetical protein U0793_23800 [Gemmataceae bacterium]
MSMRRSLFVGVIAVLSALGVADSAFAWSGFVRCLYREKAPPRLVQATYQVADLVIPIPSKAPGTFKPLPELVEPGKDAKGEEEQSPKERVTTKEDALIQLIMSTAAPETWNTNGGPGTMQYFPLGMSLVINTTPQVHEEVRSLLEALRRMQDVNVVVEMRVLRINPEALDGILQTHQIRPVADKDLLVKPGKDERAVTPSGPAWRVKLEPQQLRRVLEQAQDDRRSALMQAPKLTLFNGQRSQIEITDRQTYLVGASFDVEKDGGALQQKTKTFVLGTRFGVHPTVSADRKSVRLELEASMAQRGNEAPLTPVMFVGGTEPAQVFLERPSFEKVHLACKETLADGESLVLHCGSFMTETRTEFRPPLLSRVPYVNRLFRNVAIGREASSVLIIVTPRVLITEPAPQEARTER